MTGVWNTKLHDCMCVTSTIKVARNIRIVQFVVNPLTNICNFVFQTSVVLTDIILNTFRCVSLMRLCAIFVVVAKCVIDRRARKCYFILFSSFFLFEIWVICTNKYHLMNSMSRFYLLFFLLLVLNDGPKDASWSNTHESCVFSLYCWCWISISVCVHICKSFNAKGKNQKNNNDEDNTQIIQQTKERSLKK